MYYLNNICFLCLTRNNNVIYQNDNYLKMQRKLKYIVPEEMLTKSDIPKYICNYCVERLNSINKFRRKCLKNIAIFNEYIQTLTQNSNSFRNLSINLTDTVRHENMNEIDSNIENTDEKLISFQEIKIETSETDPESVEDDQIEDIFIDTNNINQMVIKTEDLSIKTEIDEEFTSKNEICFYESNSQNNLSGVNTFSQIHTQFDGYIPECNIEEENDFQEKFYEVNNFSHGIFNEQLLSDKCISESTTTNKNRKKPLTPAERMRLYRQRKKERAINGFSTIGSNPLTPTENMRLHSDHQQKQILNGSSTRKKQPLTGAERMRLYRQRKKEKAMNGSSTIRKTPLTAAERARLCRQRKKEKATNCSSTVDEKPSTTTEKIILYRQFIQGKLINQKPALIGSEHVANSS